MTPPATKTAETNLTGAQCQMHTGSLPVVRVEIPEPRPFDATSTPSRNP